MDIRYEAPSRCNIRPVIQTGGGGGGQGGSKEWGAGLGASGSKAACTEDEGMI